MTGRLRWPFSRRYASAVSPASVDGALYGSRRGWPVTVFGARNDVVPGILVGLDPDRLDDAWPVLDHLESTATDTLRRIAVTPTSDGVPVRADDYTGPVRGVVPIEPWDEQEDRSPHR